MNSSSRTKPSVSRRVSDLVDRQIGLLEQFVADVFLHRQRIEECALLKHHAEIRAHGHQLALAHRVHSLAVHNNAAAVGFEQSEDQLEDRRLSEPLAPRMIFVWPGSSVKLTSLRITFSSKARDTCSRAMTG